MRIDLDLTGNALDGLAGMEGQIGEALKGALKEGGRLAARQVSQEIAKTYRRPIPVSSTGKQKYQRSGDLAGGVEVQEQGDEVHVVMTGNAAEPITNYPGGYAEKLTKLNSERKNDYPQNAYNVLNGSSQLETVLRQELKNRLNL
jgi:hypothetical protein